ncbi:MAG: divalent-cation tolerance protein CutA [Thermoanaerobacterales bacterium]|nr:divalent-cation tolerance protein CutA [Bacillota bacterium]MDI6907232.1 divalent-cation tolerance protein CutA [Thermoanaerobacterales bacterium]
MAAKLVYITAGSEDEARRIARGLVERRLAACANVIPRIRSFYRWDGRLCEDDEAVVIAKTTDALAERLVAAVKELHSYEVPAVLVLDVERGYPPFLEWLAGEVRP